VIRTSAAALFAVILGGCAPSEPPLPPGTAKPVVAPTTVAAAAAPSAAPYTRELMTPLQRKLEEQRRATLPKPVEEVRPEGEPKSPEELQKLSDAAAAGTPVAKPGAPPSSASMTSASGWARCWLIARPAASTCPPSST
jgi:hypothetical protein